MISRKTPLFAYVVAVATVGVITLGLWWQRNNLTLANFSLLYILGTFGVAVWLGTGPSLLAAFLTFFGFMRVPCNWLILPNRWGIRGGRFTLG